MSNREFEVKFIRNDGTESYTTIDKRDLVAFVNLVRLNADSFNYDLYIKADDWVPLYIHGEEHE